MEITEDELQELYIWVDGIPLSRPKRNIARDFSDGGAPVTRLHTWLRALTALLHAILPPHPPLSAPLGVQQPLVHHIVPRGRPHTLPKARVSIKYMS